MSSEEIENLVDKWMRMDKVSFQKFKEIVKFKDLNFKLKFFSCTKFLFSFLRNWIIGNLSMN